MSKQNNMNDCPNQLPINLQSQPRFFPSATSSSHSDNMSMNNTDTKTYTGDYASYQCNLSEDARQSNVDTTNEQLNTSSRNQVETHTNSPCPLPAAFQTLCGPSVPHSDMTTDNNFQRSNVPNSTCISYMLIQMPASNEYVVMREERTQSFILGTLIFTNPTIIRLVKISGD